MKLHYHKLLNNFFIIAFVLTLLLISINYNIVYLFLILFLIYIYKKSKYIFVACLVLCIIITGIYYGIKIYQLHLINNYNNTITGKVIDIVKKDTYQTITIKYKMFKVKILDYDFNNIKLGMIIKVSGSLREIDINHLPNGFNYKEYFYNNLYIYEIKASNIDILKKEFSIYSFHEYFKNYLNVFFKDEELMILKAFIIGDTSDFNISFEDNMKKNGIVHLFAISGLHVSLIINILNKILGKIKFKKKIVNIFLFCYLIITKFTVSISRAVISHFLKEIFLYKNIKISAIDITSIVYILFIVLNPFIMYNTGFILSFFATFIIILVSDILKKYNKYISMILITLIINVFTLPIVVNINHEYNLLNPLINFIMVLLVETIILPCSLFVVVFPIFNILYKYIISSFLVINNLLSTVSLKLRMIITLSHLSNFLILLYYVFLILFFIMKFKNKKILKYSKVLIVIICGSIIFYTPTISSPIITFLDLYNGESTLIRYKDETILIDTGEGIKNEVTGYLKSVGISKIDYLIITHDHSDHNGEVDNILKNFFVTNIVTNEYYDNVSNINKKIIKLKKGKTLITKYLKFDCLFPYEKNVNENNNSLVLYTNINGVGILFTGDIEKEIEEEFNNINIDVLKVAHHGSLTSTSEDFINKVKPEYAVIMSGRSNIFSFPANAVVNRLISNKIKVYCTKYNYTITLKIKNKKCIFSSMMEIIK